MTRVVVGMSTCGIAAGAEETYRALERKMARLCPRRRQSGGPGASGCATRNRWWRSRRTAARGISTGTSRPTRSTGSIDEHVQHGTPVNEWLVWTSDGDGTDRDYLERQTRIVLRNCGQINPESVDDYLGGRRVRGPQSGAGEAGSRRR